MATLADKVKLGWYGTLAFLCLGALGGMAEYGMQVKKSCVVVHKSYWESTLLGAQGIIVGKDCSDTMENEYIMLRFAGDDAKKMLTTIHEKDTLSLNLPYEGKDFSLGLSHIDSLNHKEYRP
ncbi:MAG: hypothetical protein V1725_00185 [archaeon]